MLRAHHYNKPYKSQLLQKINALSTSVFTRDDLSANRSNKEQLRLNRALKAFIDEGAIIKISHGVYAKAMKMHLSNGESKIFMQSPFEDVVIEALNKLGIHWELGQAIKAYNRGETTQVPAIFSIRLNSRFRGSIRAEGRTVVFEDGINAR